MIDVAYLDLMTIRGGPVQDFFIGEKVGIYDLTHHSSSQSLRCKEHKLFVNTYRRSRVVLMTVDTGGQILHVCRS